MRFPYCVCTKVYNYPDLFKFSPWLNEMLGQNGSGNWNYAEVNYENGDFEYGVLFKEQTDATAFKLKFAL